MAKIIGNTTATPNPRPDWAQTDETKADYIKNKPTILTEDEVKSLIDQFGGDDQVQADWAQTDEAETDYIKNKPELGALALKDSVVKSDLSSDIQESLENADSAIQSIDGLATELDNKADLLQVETLSKKVSNIEDRMSDDSFITDASIAYSRTVPSDACLYAEINEVGGMTYREQIGLVAVGGPYDFSVGRSDNVGVEGCLNANVDASVTIPFTISIRLKNTAAEKQVVEFNACASAIVAGFGLPPDGEFHEYTYEFYDNFGYPDGHVGPLGQVTLAIFNEDTFEYVAPSNIEAENLMIYEKDSSYVLKHAAVTEIKSENADGTIASLVIPEAVQSLPAYGCGINSTYFNEVDWANKVYRKRVGVYEMTGGSEHLYHESSSATAPDGGAAYFCRELWNTDCKDIANNLLVCSDFRAVNWTYEIGGMYIGSGGGFLRFCVSREQFPTVEDFRQWVENRYTAGNPITLVYPLKEEVVTDISNILPDDNYIEVVPGGTIVAENENKCNPYVSITYMKKEA